MPSSTMLRGLAGLVLLALCVGAVSGCSGKKKEMRISIFEQMDPPERVQLERHLEAYRKLHPELVITHQNYETDALRQQFQTAANAGGGPDIVFGPSDQIGPFSVMGLILPLEDVLGKDYYAGFEPGSLDTLGGHLYYAPDQLGNHLMLLYNKKLTTKVPATTDEWIAEAKRLTKDTNGDGMPDQYGIVMNLVEPFWLAPFLNGYGGWVMDAKHQPTLDSPGMVGALKFLSSLRNQNLMPRECNYAVADNLFKEGKAAYLVNGPWSWTAYKASGIDLGIAPLPKAAATGRWCGPMTASKGYSVSKSSPMEMRPEVVALVKYLTSPEVGVDNADSLGTLPSMTAAYADPRVSGNPFLAASRAAYALGRRMPVVPEMRAIWDAMRPEMEKVLSGAETPEAASKAMQAGAIKQIQTMKD